MKTIENTITKLLHYSFRDTDYEFKYLTKEEKKIIHSQKMFDSIKLWMEKNDES